MGEVTQKQRQSLSNPFLCSPIASGFFWVTFPLRLKTWRQEEVTMCTQPCPLQTASARWQAMPFSIQPLINRKGFSLLGKGYEVDPGGMCDPRRQKAVAQAAHVLQNRMGSLLVNKGNLQLARTGWCTYPVVFHTILPCFWSNIAAGSSLSPPGSSSGAPRPSHVAAACFPRRQRQVPRRECDFAPGHYQLRGCRTEAPLRDRQRPWWKALAPVKPRRVNGLMNGSQHGAELSTRCGATLPKSPVGVKFTL